MTYITAEDSIANLLAAVFQVSIGHLFESLKPIMGQEIWLGAGSLCDLGSNVIAPFSLMLYEAYSPLGLPIEFTRLDLYRLAKWQLKLLGLSLSR